MADLEIHGVAGLMRSGGAFGIGSRSAPRGAVSLGIVVPRAAFVCLVVLTSMVVPYGATAILALAATVAMLGAGLAVRALGVLLLVRIANPAVLGDLMGPVALLGWLVIAIAGARICAEVLARGVRIPYPVIGLLLFFVVTCALSLLASEHREVSLFKISSFTFGSIALLLGTRRLAERGVSLVPDLVAMWFGVLALSLPLLANRSVGYFRDDLGFQGVTAHPQVLAVFCAPALVWAGFQVLLHGMRAGIVAWSVFVLSLVEIYFTRGRTAVAAAGLAGFLVLVIALSSRSSWREELRGSRMLTRIILLFVLAGASATFYADTAREAVVDFAFKGVTEESTTVGESFQTSRGFLLVEEFGNFLASPWTGIGFGVSRSATHPFEPVVEPITGLAIGAPTEKANLVIALLEEVGIVGTLAFLPFIVMLFLRITRNAGLALGGAALAVLAVNLSEMVFFSMGALGLYVFIVFGVAAYSPEASRPTQFVRVSQPLTP